MTRAYEETTRREDVGRVPRRRGAVNGFLVVLLGLWGATVPLFGPYLGLAYGTDAAWVFTWDRVLLNFLPGLLVVLGGLGLRASARSAGGVLWGWIAALGGAWFVLGPTVSSIWSGGRPATGEPVATEPSLRAAAELVHHLGLGTLIVFLAAVALGRFTAGTGRVVADVPEQHRGAHDDHRDDLHDEHRGSARDNLRGGLHGDLRGDAHPDAGKHRADGTATTAFPREDRDAPPPHQAPAQQLPPHQAPAQQVPPQQVPGEQPHRSGWLGSGDRR